METAITLVELPAYRYIDGEWKPWPIKAGTTVTAQAQDEDGQPDLYLIVDHGGEIKTVGYATEKQIRFTA